MLYGSDKRLSLEGTTCSGVLLDIEELMVSFLRDSLLFFIGTVTIIIN